MCTVICNTLLVTSALLVFVLYLGCWSCLVCDCCTFELSFNSLSLSFHSWWNVGIACMNPGWSSKPFQRTSLSMFPVWQTDLHCFQLSFGSGLQRVTGLCMTVKGHVYNWLYFLLCFYTHHYFAQQLQSRKWILVLQLHRYYIYFKM